ncbi:MAG: trimethylamine methyltransferase family protein, partial [Candidatus Aminicenantes bacterium]|nr:trimethylamine methyltransferase family protein [Candidatus Aminicenantes bacterium]
MCEFTERPPIIPLEVKSGMRINVLDDRDLRQIQEATFSILEDRGIMFPSEKALRILAEGGARVNLKTKIAKFPSDWLESILSKAPRSIVMASRTSPDLDLVLDGTKTYYGTDGVGVRTVDFETHKERLSTKEDVAMMALISDYLPCVGFFWPIVSAQNVPSKSIPLHELDASFNNTEKHVHIVSCVEESAA